MKLICLKDNKRKKYIWSEGESTWEREKDEQIKRSTNIKMNEKKRNYILMESKKERETTFKCKVRKIEKHKLTKRIRY
jgi:hypothetical protein